MSRMCHSTYYLAPQSFSFLSSVLHVTSTALCSAPKRNTKKEQPKDVRMHLGADSNEMQLHAQAKNGFVNVTLWVPTAFVKRHV